MCEGQGTWGWVVGALEEGDVALRVKQLKNSSEMSKIDGRIPNNPTSSLQHQQRRSTHNEPDSFDFFDKNLELGATYTYEAV